MQYKYCPKCGEYKYRSDFSLDRSKSDGLHGWCKYCRSESMKKTRRKKTLKAQRSHKMTCTGEQFYDEFYKKEWIHDEINKQASYKTKNYDLRKDLIQEAWIRLSFCYPGLSDIEIEKVIYKAISQAYQKEWNKKNYDLSYIETMSFDEYAMWRTGIYMP